MKWLFALCYGWKIIDFSARTAPTSPRSSGFRHSPRRTAEIQSILFPVRTEIQLKWTPRDVLGNSPSGKELNPLERRPNGPIQQHSKPLGRIGTANEIRQNT
jgi:hypothetical protein